MTEIEFKEKLRNFIAILADSKKIDTKTSLFDEGIIDSMKILDLIAFVEEAASVRIPDDAVVMKNFENIEAISRAFYKVKSAKK